MRVLVCGGRDFSDKQLFLATMDMLHSQTPITCVISGMARGADTMGITWAQLRGVPVAKFPANWTKFGKMAGFVRNQQMLDEGRPDQVVAFPGGRGTADMVRRSRAAGVPTLEVKL